MKKPVCKTRGTGNKRLSLLTPDKHALGNICDSNQTLFKSNLLRQFLGQEKVHFYGKDG